MALLVTKTVGGIEITTYAVITKFWHAKFEVGSIATGETIPVLNPDTQQPMLDTDGNEMTQQVYRQTKVAYIQIEYFKDRDTANEIKSSPMVDIIMLSDFDPNLNGSVLEQLYTLLKEQKAEFRNAIDVLE